LRDRLPRGSQPSEPSYPPMSSPRARDGPFVFPDARPSSKLKAPRGKETRSSSLFYGKGGTKFPNTVTDTLASKTFRPPTVRALWQSQRTEMRYWDIIAENSARSF